MKTYRETQTFFSPIVMRKEMESLLILEGEKVLRTSSFVDTRPTLYWNLLYGTL